MVQGHGARTWCKDMVHGHGARTWCKDMVQGHMVQGHGARTWCKDTVQQGRGAPRPGCVQPLRPQASQLQLGPYTHSTRQQGSQLGSGCANSACSICAMAGACIVICCLPPGAPLHGGERLSVCSDIACCLMELAGAGVHAHCPAHAHCPFQTHRPFHTHCPLSTHCQVQTFTLTPRPCPLPRQRPLPRPHSLPHPHPLSPPHSLLGDVHTHCPFLARAPVLLAVLLCLQMGENGAPLPLTSHTLAPVPAFVGGKGLPASVAFRCVGWFGCWVQALCKARRALLHKKERSSCCIRALWLPPPPTARNAWGPPW